MDIASTPIYDAILGTLRGSDRAVEDSRYLLKAGDTMAGNLNLGGNSLIGNTTSGGTLTLSSTSHATKGKILFGTSAYDEVNNWLGIGIATPLARIHSVETVGSYNQILTFSGSYSNKRNFGFRGTSDTTGLQGVLNLDALDDSGALVRNVLTATHGGNVGIGTTNSLTKLTVLDTSSSSPRGILSMQISDDTNGARAGFSKARGTITSPAVVATGDTLGSLMFRGYDGTNYLELASIEAGVSGTVASTRVPTFLAFSTATNAAPSVLTERMRIDNAGNVGFGISPTAPVHIQTTWTGAGTKQAYLLNVTNSDNLFSSLSTLFDVKYNNASLFTIDYTGSLNITQLGNNYIGGIGIGRQDELWQNSTNGVDALWINYRGYLGGGTQYRDVKICDGKLNTTPIAYFQGSTGRVGIGVSAPAAKTEILATTEQLRLGYDDSNYQSFTVGSDGKMSIIGTGTASWLGFGRTPTQPYDSYYTSTNPSVNYRTFNYAATYNVTSANSAAVRCTASTLTLNTSGANMSGEQYVHDNFFTKQGAYTANSIVNYLATLNIENGAVTSWTAYKTAAYGGFDFVMTNLTNYTIPDFIYGASTRISHFRGFQHSLQTINASAVISDAFSIYMEDSRFNNYLAGKLSIGAYATVDTTNDINLEGRAARKIWTSRNTTSNTAGNSLTIQSGGATAAATDKNGGDLILAPGLATGTGQSGVQIQGCVAGSTGTGDNSLATQIQVLGNTIGFWGSTATAKQTLSAYTTNAQSSAYTGAADGEAKLADLNSLRVAYENLRAAYDDLRTKLQTTTLVA